MMANATDGQLDFFGVADGSGALRDEAQPVLKDGTWGKAEALIFARHLKRGDLSEALEVLGALSNDGARAVLCQAGFTPQATGGRRAMLESVQDDLMRAAQLKMTGVELRAAAGVAGPSVGRDRVFPGAVAAPSFSRALKALQQVLSAPVVEVGVAGPGDLGSRQSLQFVGAQAIERGVSGFAIEGITGKFRLPDSVDLAGLRSLYEAAGGAMAEAEVRAAMPGWANGKGAVRLSDLVPDATAKVLRGSPSVPGAETLRSALADGSVREFGGVQGVRLAGQVLAQQGVQIDALPVEQVAINGGLRLIKPDTRRGQYVGPVVAQDHRASVLKTSREGALLLPHKELPAGIGKPNKGDLVVVKFGGDRMQVNVQQGGAARAVGR